MLLRELKPEFLMPDKEVIINKAYKAQGEDAVLAALTSQNGRQMLWVICHSPKTDGWDEKHKLKTNRDIFMRSFENPAAIIPREMLIRGHKITFSRGRGSTFQNGFRAYMQLQHFAERKVDLSVFDGADLSRILILAMEVSGDVPFAEISPPLDGNIVLKIPETFRQQYIGKAYDLPFGMALPDERLTFFDNENKDERHFYINRLARHDVWKALEESEERNERLMESWKQQGMSDERIDAIVSSMRTTRESTYPRGFDLAYVEYEAEDDIQLLFYEKEYLEGEPERNGSGIGLFSTVTEKGPHGLKLQTCVLKKPIPKDFDGNISIELFSCNIKIPGETIVL